MVGILRVDSNHGDHFRPLRIGLDWTPSKWPNFMAPINGGDPNYLQVLG